MFVDVAHDAGRQIEHRPAIFGDESLIAVAEAVDLSHAVAIVQLHDQRPDHVVEPRAEAAAGDDAGAGFGGIEENFAARPGRLERRQLIDRSGAGTEGRTRVVEQDPVGLVDIVKALPPGVQQAASGESMRQGPSVLTSRSAASTRCCIGTTPDTKQPMSGKLRAGSWKGQFREIGPLIRLFFVSQRHSKAGRIETRQPLGKRCPARMQWAARAIVRGRRCRNNGGSPTPVPPLAGFRSSAAELNKSSGDERDLMGC